MTNTQFKITIDRPVERVWDIMLEPLTYQIWAQEFSPDSSTSYEGNWSEGSIMRFFGPDKDGKKQGMYFNVVKNDKYKLLKMEVVGSIDGEDEVAVPEWKGMEENYSFKKLSGSSMELGIDIFIIEEWKEFMVPGWNNALAKLKYICEHPEIITIEAVINAPVSKVWDMYTDPDKVKIWNHASDDWHCPEARNDLRVGGEFHYTMAAKEGNATEPGARFDFSGVYTRVEEGKSIDYVMPNGRVCEQTFENVSNNSTKLIVRFEAEGTFPPEMQKQGWMSILENFKKECEK